MDAFRRRGWWRYPRHFLKIVAGSIWAESVFHVLAHVGRRLSHLAPSCYSPKYIAWAAQHVGPRSTELDHDVTVIEAGADSHDRLARLQSLAFVFASEAQVAAVRDRELASLKEEDVESWPAMRSLSPVTELAEVLRAAAELEMPRLSPVTESEIGADLVTALNDIVKVAPKLVDYTVGLVRPLGLRGRVLGSLILVGAPGIEADVEHIAWQAAHEATVNEVNDRDWATSERRAIGLLRSRARAAGGGLADSHARWIGRFDLSSLGSIPDVEDST